MDGCYGGGAIVGAVIGTFIATLVAVALATFLFKRRKAKQNPLRDLVLVESGDVKGGYENIGFTDDPHPMTNTKPDDPDKGRKPSTTDGKSRENPIKEGQTSTSGEIRKSPWAHFGFLLGHSKGSHRHSFDAASSPPESPEEYSVSLKGHDFTGLGFSVGGGAKEGITVKEVMQRGPAAESARILPGDRIKGLWVSFDEVVLPDAVAILGYASPYAVKLDIVRGSSAAAGVSTGTGKRESLGRGEKVSHPSFKSSSAMDLSQVGKEEPIAMTPAKIEVVDRASPVAIPMTTELVQMKSPDILDMRPSAVPRNKEKRQMSSVVEVVQAVSPTAAKIELKSKIQCADVPDGILAHMEGVTSKEQEPNSNLAPLPVTAVAAVADAEKTEPVPKKSKFGMHVLPDLHFGRRSSSPLSTDSPKPVEEKRKTPKGGKPDKKEPKTAESPTREDSGPAVISPEVTECHEKEQRPSSADSNSSRKKFHIRLFHKSKQYTLEPESEGNEDHPGSSDPKDEPTEFKVRKIEDVEMEAIPVQSAPPPVVPPEPALSELPEKHDRSFVSKGLQTLREFKDKVTQKLSSHDTEPTSSEDESGEKSEGVGKARKKSKGKKSKAKKLSSDEPGHHTANGIEATPENDKDQDLTSDSEIEADEGKPSKPKRSTKRKAPVPPTAPPPKMSTTVTTAATLEVLPPSPVDGTNPSKLFDVSGGETNKRSASYGDLATTQAHPPHQINLSDRATSLDLRPSPASSHHITTTAVVNDLSRVSDQLLYSPAGRSDETLSSSTASSSLETLKEPSPTTTLVHGSRDDEDGPMGEQVEISTTGSTVVSMEEVERVARETVQEIFNRVNGMEGPLEPRRGRSSDKKPSRIPVPASKLSPGQVSIVQEEPKEKKKVLLRDDSKTRLMQTVADANDIKISPVTSPPPPTRLPEPKTLEISAKELDGVMMSHSEFLAKQGVGQGGGVSPPKDTSFDTWIYVDQKHQTSSSDPASSSHEDEDDMNDSRNLSPVTFRSEAQFDTSTTGVEVTMGASPPGQGGGGGTVFSTTMTLPQRTVTQITIAPEGNTPKKAQTSVGTIQLPSLEPTGK